MTLARLRNTFRGGEGKDDMHLRRGIPFNVRNGQVRVPKATNQPYERGKGKVKKLIAVDLVTGKKHLFHADRSTGIMLITVPSIMRQMANNGWPIDRGSDGKGGRRLLWNDQPDNPISDYNLILAEGIAGKELTEIRELREALAQWAT